MAFTDNYIFTITPSPTQKNQSKIEWRGFLDPDTQEIVIYDDAAGAELFRIGGTGGGGITGSGTAGHLPVFSAGTVVGDSNAFQDANGNIGIGTTTPAAKLHVEGVNAAGINQKLEPLAGINENTLGATGNTVGLATVFIKDIPIPADSGLIISSVITSRKTGGAGLGTVGDVNGYMRTVKAKNVGGVVTLGVTEAAYTTEDIIGFSVTYVVSGTNVRLGVTGLANDNVTWNALIKTYNVQ